LKVIIVSYYWPPSGGSGVQRWMYFAKHLVENGIEPIVVTISPENAAYSTFDESLVKQVEHIETHHTTGGFQILKFYSFLKSGNTKKQIPVGDIGDKKKSKFDKLSAYIRANYFIPDARVGWNKKAIPEIEKIIKKEKIDFIITTGPPHSTHLIGLEIKNKYNLKWVADFRDPWTEVYYNNLFKRTKRADLKDKSLEIRVLNKADLVLTVGPSMRKMLADKLPNNESKVHAILNGFDEEKLSFIQGKRYQEFTIAHIGIWTLQQANTEIVSALKQIASENKDWQIRFVLVGNIHPEIIQNLQNIPNLIVDHRGKVSHQDALQEMMNADLLLNCQADIPNSKLIISGKHMEYLATGNNMIVIGNKEGDAAELMKGNEKTRMISPKDEQELKNSIIYFYQLERKTPLYNLEMNQYSRKSTAKELADLLRKSL
jgi:glycosyltransferase involved in cell wall biosynthesis